jgi:glyoxylase-like metal-dependent hydrolase (beta-lactamase superfamily II)
MSSMRVGEIEIVALKDGEARMAPTQAYPTSTNADWVPHKRWLNHDGQLEIPIGCFLIRTGGRLVLVDAGLGTIQAPGFTGGRLLDELARAGVKPADVSDVVFTHLHFDHVGWATQQGSVVFTNATYRCHVDDWAHFVTGSTGSGEGVNAPGAGARKLMPLQDRLEAFDGPATIAPGIDTLPTPGHTPGHTALVISSGAERAMLLGDATHCPVELEQSEWDGLGDVDPALAKRTRAAMFAELERSGTPATAAHFPGLAFGRVLRAEGKAQWVV